MINNKFKLISASAITLIALTGTAYGTGINEDAKVNETEEVQELDEQNLEEQNLDEKEKDSDNQESKPQDSSKPVEDSDKENSEEQESDKDESDSDEQESGKDGSDKEESEEQDKDDSDKEESEEQETVDETKVVPLEDLPIHKDTGLLDFAKYHEIAKGRALPRELTEKERDYFEEYVHVGHYEEERIRVTDTTYHLVRIYPESYYKEKDTIDMKWHKYTEVYSELLTLDKQKAFLAEREQEYQDSIEAGFIYNEELGDFELPLSEDDDIHHGVEDPKDEEGILGDQDPVENDDVVQHIHFEEMPLRENLGEYNEMTHNEFIKEYGVSFFYRSVVEKNGFAQQEYKLTDGLTLAVEAEHYTEDGSDDIFITWGVVKEPIRYEGNKGGLTLEGRYNFTDNVNHEDYIEGNVLETSQTQLRANGKSTPQKIYVEYNDSNNEPHLYLLIADAVLDGEKQPTHSGVVGHLEFGWDVNVSANEPGGGTDEKPEKPEGEDTDKDPDTDGEDNNNKDDEDDKGSGTDNNQTGSGGSNNNQSDSDKGSVDSDNNQPDSETGSGDSDSDNEDSDDKESSNEQFQQTGTSILWGMLATGLGLGTVGAFLRKKSNKEETEDKKEE